MRKKPKVLLANFDRLEKLLLFNLLLNNSIEIIGIVSDHTPQTLAKFIEYDSNHGKFSFGKIIVKENKTEKRIMIQSKNAANIQIFSSDFLNKKNIEKHQIDFLVNLSSECKKEQLLKYQKLGLKAIFALANKQTIDSQNLELISFGLNHKKMDLSKNNLFIVAPIEATISCLLNERLRKYSPSVELYFQIIRGPHNGMNLLDSLETKDKQKNYSRSIINNIIPNRNKFVNASIERLLRESATELNISGDMVHIPVTTGALITLVFQGKKIVKEAELIKTLKESTDDLIGYSVEGLVSQDAVSMQEYAVVDEKLLSCLNNKNLSVMKLGLWYDFESSLVMNIFKLLLYVSGLPEFA